MSYIVVNIGCIECGVDSNIVGIFEKEEKANEVARICNDKYEWRHGGQNDFEVFKTPEMEEINPEYELDLSVNYPY